ncbi:unnamed protein product [Leptidea sinapis]|uniref:C2H2-type domain-containing protein n=1 Tax=Leptidea sinapis TaxID=189913 RepID=A0A5E4QLP2_9NEOP|nr:unnamed protein product [Leptidea sinapis]
MLVHVNLVHLKLHEMGPQQGLNQLRSLLGDQIDVEVLNDRSSLTMTRESKKSERTHECHICHRKFKRKQHLKVHANVHLKKKPTVFCSSCNEGFVSREQYESHSCQVEMILGDRDFGPHHESPTSDDIKKENFPEDLLEAPSNTKLRVPLQIKVPYQMVMSLDNGEQRAVTVDPSDEMILP